MVESNQAIDPQVEVITGLTQSIIASNEDEPTFQGLSLLQKLVENKIKSPEEAKFNSFKRTNAKVVEKILSLQGGINDLIVALGFTVTSDDRYEFTGDLKQLKKGAKAIETQLEPMKVARMTPEERQKHELLKQQKAEYARVKAAEKARKDEMLRMQAADRKEKGTEEVKASIGNKLNFGAQTKVFKPPVSR